MVTGEACEVAVRQITITIKLAVADNIRSFLQHIPRNSKSAVLFVLHPSRCLQHTEDEDY